MERLGISVVFCGDATYFQHMGVAIASLLRSNAAHDFRILVCSEKTETEAQGKLSAVASRFGNASVTFLQFDMGRCRQQFRLDHHLTIASYLRLFITEFLDPNTKKVLYLDCDVIVSGDIGELWQTDLGGAFAAAVPDVGVSPHLGFEPGDAYFNAGVMLIDVARWRAASVLPEFLQLALDNSSSLKYHDQDVLNCVLRGKIKALEYRWNFQTFFPGLPPGTLNTSSESFRQLRRSPSIVHFTTEYKPWFYRYEPHYKKLYYEALALTPWRNYRPPDRTPRNILLKLIKMKYLKERMRWYAPSFSRFLRKLWKGHIQRSLLEKQD